MAGIKDERDERGADDANFTASAVMFSHKAMVAAEMQDILRQMVAARPADGAPHVRDVEAPCKDFEPGEPDGHCETDGHYLCLTCKEAMA